MTYGKFNFKNGKVKNITQISISVTAPVMDPVKFILIVYIKYEIKQ